MDTLTYITARGNEATITEMKADHEGNATYYEKEENQPNTAFSARSGFVKAKHDLMCFFNKDKILRTA